MRAVLRLIISGKNVGSFCKGREIIRKLFLVHKKVVYCCTFDSFSMGESTDSNDMYPGNKCFSSPEFLWENSTVGLFRANVVMCITL